MSEASTDSSKKVAYIAIAIAAISLCCSLFVLTSRPQATPEAAPEATATSESEAEVADGMTQDHRYVLYVGTNDKDTYKMEMSKEEARQKVDAILLKHFGGYTLQEAGGYWMDDEGNPTNEYTLVCIIDEPDVDEVYKACDEIREALNQNTVLVEHTVIDMQYYAGS